MRRKNILYIILDAGLIARKKKNIFHIAKLLLEERVDFIQFRFKDVPLSRARKEARKLKSLFRHYKKTKFLINDSPAIARLAGAAGVHLGADDPAPSYARKLLGRRAIIGKTVHSLCQAKKFIKEPVDYLSIGPVFKTSLKPGLAPLGIKKLKEITAVAHKLNPRLCLLAVGGINLKNVSFLFKQGINNIAVASEIILSKNPGETIRAFRNLAQ